LTGKSLSQAAIQRREIGSVSHRLKQDPQQDALYRGYKQALERLKTQYHNAGLTVIRPAKPKVSRAGVPQRCASPGPSAVVFFIPTAVQ